MHDLQKAFFHVRIVHLRNLLRKPQMEIISQYGFHASEEGIEEMEMALESLEEDGDIYVAKLQS